jgi:hypothetical protein
MNGRIILFVPEVEYERRTGLQSGTGVPPFPRRKPHETYPPWPRPAKPAA